jgi:shikimate kinase
MSNISLIGFMGAGKTAVAKKLAAVLGRELVSIDALIVDREKRSINEIFFKEGEAYFRSIEKETIKNMSGRDHLVIDCGGGAALDHDNMCRLKENGIVVYLKARSGTIYDRIKGDCHRPLLKVDDPRAKIQELLALREPFYFQADVVVNTDEKSLDDVTEEILSFIKASGPSL